jgi:hypothetical protein
VSGRESFGSADLHAGEGAHVDCHTYDRTTPILSVRAGRMRVNISIADRTAMPAHAVTFARELAAQAAVFAAECERLHAALPAPVAKAAAGEDAGLMTGGTAGSLHLPAVPGPFPHLA